MKQDGSEPFLLKAAKRCTKAQDKPPRQSWQPNKKNLVSRPGSHHPANPHRYLRPAVGTATTHVCNPSALACHGLCSST